MRKDVLLLPVLLSVVPLGLGLQSPPVPRTDVEPERQSVQQQYKDFTAQTERLRNQAKHAFDAEMEREKVGDCRDARGTREINECASEAVQKTDASLNAYEDAIRNRLKLKNPGMYIPSVPTQVGEAPPTALELAAEFDKTETAWRGYLDSACIAVGHQWIGGSGRGIAELGCHTQLVRSHLRDVDYLYFSYLHVCGGCSVSASPQRAGETFAGGISVVNMELSKAR